MPYQTLEELINTTNCEFFSEDKTKKRKVLILGASGLIGSSLFREFLCYDSFLIFGTYNFDKSHNDFLQLDLEKIQDTIDIVNNINPDVIIWAAENEYSKENLKIKKTFIELLQNISSNTKFIFFSTDAVFSGEKGDYSEKDSITIPSKNNYMHDYITGKIERENFIKALPNSIIVRTGPVYGKNLNRKWDFRSEAILSQIQNSNSIIVKENFIRNFINNKFLAKNILKLCIIDFRGIIHITNFTKRSTSNHYKLLAEYNGFNSSLILEEKQSENKDLSLNNSLFMEINQNLNY